MLRQGLRVLELFISKCFVSRSSSIYIAHNDNVKWIRGCLCPRSSQSHCQRSRFRHAFSIFYRYLAFPEPPRPQFYIINFYKSLSSATICLITSIRPPRSFLVFVQWSEFEAGVFGYLMQRWSESCHIVSISLGFCVSPFSRS